MSLWHNFMLQDFVRAFAAVLLYPLLTLVPGYFLAASANLLSFRKQDLLDRLAISIAISIGTVPVLLYLAGHFASFTGMWIAMGLLWAGGLITAIAETRRAPAATLRQIPFLGAFAIAAFLIFTVADLQWHGYLLGSQTQIDHVKHVAVTDALFRTGPDAVNPFFHPGYSLGLFYYPFWQLIGSFVEHIGHPLVTARAAVLGGIPWAAFSLIALLRVFLRFFTPRVPASSFGTAVVLLLVSGLDIIPVTIYNVLFFTAHIGRAFAQLEWWNVQVTSWLGSVYWVPQHIVGLVANLTGVLLLRFSSEQRLGRAAHIVLAGLCFATGVGASVWVTAACALGCAAWVCLCIKERRSSEAAAFSAAAVVAGIAALPYLLHLRSISQMHTAPIAPYVREFGPLLGLLAAQPGAVKAAVSLLVLPLNYFLEFGFYAVAAGIWVYQVRRRQGPVETNDKLALVFTLASLTFVTFAKSTMGFNDLGFRGVLPAQFFLLLCAVQVLHAGNSTSPLRATSYRPWLSRALVACAVLGLLTTGWDWLGGRFAQLAGSPAKVRPRLAYRYQLRAAYDFLRERLPVTAITQHDPDVSVSSPIGLYGEQQDPNGERDKMRRLVSYAYGLYGERQVAAADWLIGPLLSIDANRYEETAKKIIPVFAVGSSPELVDQVASAYSIQAFVVTSYDPVWADRTSWVWQRKPDLALDSVRVYIVGSPNWRSNVPILASRPPA